MLELAIITAIVSIAGITITKILRQSTDFRLKLLKKDFNELERYTDELEKENKSLKNALNNRERGPQIEDNGDWSGIIQSLVGDLESFVPRKLRPLFQDKDLQNALIQKFMENPERYKELIKRFVLPKGEKPQVVDDAI